MKSNSNIIKAFVSLVYFLNKTTVDNPIKVRNGEEQSLLHANENDFSEICQYSLFF